MPEVMPFLKNLATELLALFVGSVCLVRICEIVCLN